MRGKPFDYVFVDDVVSFLKSPKNIDKAVALLGIRPKAVDLALKLIEIRIKLTRSASKELAEEYDAMVLVDDSHASGFIGKTGRGTHEHFGVMDRVDLITTTFGKGLGGASGGCVSGRAELVELCRQKARPYLFSNSLAPSIVNASIKVIDLVSSSTERRDKLEWNANYFRQQITAAGLCIRPGETPIVPVMLYNAKLANDMARDMYAEGIYVIGFFFPVVPAGAARIRVQLSAAHEKEHIDRAVAAFAKVGEKYSIIGLDKKGIIEKYGM